MGFILILFVIYIIALIFGAIMDAMENTPVENKTIKNTTESKSGEESIHSLFELAIQAKRVGNYDLSEKYYKKLIQLEPNLPSIYSSMAKVQYLNGDYAMSLTNFLYSLKMQIILDALIMNKKGESTFYYRMNFLTNEGRESIIYPYKNINKNIALSLFESNNEEEKDTLKNLSFYFYDNAENSIKNIERSDLFNAISIYNKCNRHRMTGKSLSDFSGIDFSKKYGQETEHSMDEMYEYIGTICAIEILDWENIEEMTHLALTNDNYISKETLKAIMSNT